MNLNEVVKAIDRIILDSLGYIPEINKGGEYKNMNGYEKIESELRLNDLACIEDIIVTIKCGDTILNAILQPNDDFDSYIWDWDWWEGEQNVELIGAIAKGDIRIYGNKLEYKENA